MTALRGRDVLTGLAAGAVVGAAGAWLYVTVYDAGRRNADWLTLPIAAVLVLAVLAGARLKRGWPLAVIAAVLVVLTSFFASNFAQRAQLKEGIAGLQVQWPQLQAQAAGPPPGGPGPGSTGLTDLIPPENLIPVLPAPAFETMIPGNLASIWTKIPPETRAQINPELAAEVERLLAQPGGPPPPTDQSNPVGVVGGPPTPAPALDPAPLPKAVVRCAQAPDFTAPDAAAGLGFPDGVPLVLPAQDLFGPNRVRGDGQEAKQPSPACFAREDAKEHPVAAGGWLIGLVLAVAVPLLLGRRRTR